MAAPQELPGRARRRRRPAALAVLVALALAACDAHATAPREAPGAPADVPTSAAAAAVGPAAAPPAQGTPEHDDAGEVGTLPGERAVADPLFAYKFARSQPDDDDWETEKVSERIQVTLAPVKQWLTAAAAERPSLAAVATPDFASTAVRPGELQRTHEDAAFSVWKPAQAPEDPRPASLERLLGDALDAFAGRPAGHVELKLVEVSLQGDRVAARFLCHADGPGPEGPRQVNATWHCEFVQPAEDAPPLASLRVGDYEETHARGPRAFEDVTEAVLGANPSYAEQLSVGLDAWAGRIDVALGMSLIGHGGLAVGDADGDGLDDLYVCEPGGLPNLLFLRRPDGTAVDASRASGVDLLDGSRSALFCDLDGDGHQDLVVEADPVLMIFAGDGAGHFEQRCEGPAPSTTSLAAADYDGDGDLDLFACGYMLPDEADRTPIPYDDANNGRPNTMLRNDIEGDVWSFTDVTRESGLDHNNRRFSFAAAFEDYDDDGDPDLYVANDFGRNNLYRNDGGHFTDVAAEAGVEDISAGMGVTWTDVDRDGRMDLYVSNMFSSAGGRIAYQRRFHSDLPDEVREHYRRHARGNTLFKNLGDGHFADVTEEAGVSMGRWAWGAVACDLQNDGWPDLFVPNGFVTGEDPRDL